MPDGSSPLTPGATAGESIDALHSQAPMDWPAPEWVDELDSTNAELIRRIASGSSTSVGAAVAQVPGMTTVPGTTVVALSQRDGRGRQGRSWLGSVGESLLFSVALPLRGIAPDRVGWLPLLVGVACVEGMRSWLSEDEGVATSSSTSPSTSASTSANAKDVPPSTDRQRSAEVSTPRLALKWPNDVVVLDGRHEVMGKCAGILLEATSDWAVAGVGVNVGQSAGVLDAIPITGLPATSLAAEWGAVAGRDGELAAVLASIRGSMHRWWHAWESAGFDPNASGLRAAYLGECATLGADVEVHLPGGGIAGGHVEGLSEQGWLILRESTDGQVSTVSAGDVVHVRHR